MGSAGFGSGFAYTIHIAKRGTSYFGDEENQEVIFLDSVVLECLAVVFELLAVGDKLLVFSGGLHLLLNLFLQLLDLTIKGFVSVRLRSLWAQPQREFAGP